MQIRALFGGKKDDNENNKVSEYIPFIVEDFVTYIDIGSILFTDLLKIILSYICVQRTHCKIFFW